MVIIPWSYDLKSFTAEDAEDTEGTVLHSLARPSGVILNEAEGISGGSTSVPLLARSLGPLKKTRALRDDATMSEITADVMK